MSYTMTSCGLEDDHEPHWLQAPPEGGVGGTYCEGSGAGESEFITEFKEWLHDRKA